MLNENKYSSLYKIVFSDNNFNYLKRKTFFVTGGTGFLGFWFLKSINYLNLSYNLGIQIYLLVRRRENVYKIRELKNTKFHIIYGGLNDFGFEKYPIDHILHLAAETSLEKNKNYIDVINTIINGTLRITEYSNFISATSITYLSSGGVYGKHCKQKKGWEENDTSSPYIYDDVATYGISKKCAEKILVEGFKSSKRLNTLNIFRAFSFGGSFFNSNNHFAYDNFIKNRFLSKNIELKSKGESIRNYMHPLDLANWILQSLKLKKINIINTGSEKNISIYELAKKIANFNFNRLPKVQVEIGEYNKIENYIPNLDKSRNLGLKSKLSIDIQIKDSLNYYYTKYDKKRESYSIRS